MFVEFFISHRLQCWIFAKKFLIQVYVRLGQNFPSIWNFKRSSRIWNYMKNVTFSRPGQVPRPNTSLSISFLTIIFYHPKLELLTKWKKLCRAGSGNWKKFYTIIFHVFFPVESNGTICCSHTYVHSE